jgi:GNAT superfamily N-acetyltransferase
VVVAVRRARPGDEEAVAAVHVRGWQVGYRGLLPVDGLAKMDPAGPARRYTFGDERQATFVAVLDERIVGFATVGRMRGEDGDQGELYAIYVDPDGWGRGSGQALIVAARQWLVEQGFVFAGLWMLAGNERAERFYRADGWELDGATKAATIFGQDVVEVRFTRPL